MRNLYSKRYSKCYIVKFLAFFSIAILTVIKTLTFHSSVRVN